MAKLDLNQVFEHYRKEVLKMNPETYVARLGYCQEGNQICIPWFTEQYRLNCRTGQIVSEDGFEVPLEDKTLILHQICFSEENAVHSGKWVSFQSLRSARLLENRFREQAVKPVESRFSGKLDEFKQACERIGGKAGDKGDASYIIPILPSISLYYIFYDCDEEFPASCNILFEADAEQWIHAEDLWMVGATVTRKLLKSADLQSGGSEKEKDSLKLTILYISESGNTAAAAEYIEEGIKSSYPDMQVRRMDLTEPESYDIRFLQESQAVIMGSPVYFGDIQWKLKQWFDSSIRLKLQGKLGGVFATERSISGGAELAMMSMAKYMFVKEMMVYSPKCVYIGPVALGNKLEEFKTLFQNYGEQFAAQVMHIFADRNC